MFCPKCGNENQDTNRFCKKCGRQLPERSAIRQAPASGLIGHILDGKYRIDAKLGSGGMGDVYQATRLLIGDTVAIKVLHGHLARDPAAAERFRREAVTATKLRHRNIVTIFDVGIAAGHNVPYILMELAEGYSLRQFLKGGTLLPLEFAVTVTAQVCAALDEAHRLGIIHRDIKPENIIAHQTGPAWEVRILDFGIAKLHDQTDIGLTQDGSAMGTPQYMSPEQCMGERVGPTSDIYSVGILLFEMLCGTVPFKGPTTLAVSNYQIHSEPPKPSAFNDAIHPEVEAVILKALAKSSGDRQQTAGQLSKELIAAATVAYRSGHTELSGAPIASPAVTPDFVPVEPEEAAADLSLEDVSFDPAAPTEVLPSAAIVGALGALDRINKPPDGSVFTEPAETEPAAGILDFAEATETPTVVAPTIPDPTEAMLDLRTSDENCEDGGSAAVDHFIQTQDINENISLETASERVESLSESATPVQPNLVAHNDATEPPPESETEAKSELIKPADMSPGIIPPITDVTSRDGVTDEIGEPEPPGIEMPQDSSELQIPEIDPFATIEPPGMGDMPKDVPNPKSESADNDKIEPPAAASFTRTTGEITVPVFKSEDEPDDPRPGDIGADESTSTTAASQAHAVEPDQSPASMNAEASTIFADTMPGRRSSNIRAIVLATLALLTASALIAGIVIFWPKIAVNWPETTITPHPTPSPTSTSPPDGMALVPGGEFMMGSAKGDEYSRPEHKVVVAPFFMDVTEVTNAAYKEFVDATGHQAPPDWKDASFPAGKGNFPVTGVNWEDASAYAKWADKRLPTEAEWEFAARGTDGRLFPWGNKWDRTMANAGGASRGMREVGQGAQSPFGIYDMSGNAWEWTASDAIAYPGGTAFRSDPPDMKIIRGGCWINTANEASAVNRAGWGATSEKDYANTGFRCVKDIS